MSKRNPPCCDDRIKVFNQSGEEIPPYSFLQVVGGILDENDEVIPAVAQPDGSSCVKFYVSGEDPIPIEEYAMACDPLRPTWVKIPESAEIDPSTEIGPVEGEWTASEEGKGFQCLYVDEAKEIVLTVVSDRNCNSPDPIPPTDDTVGCLCGGCQDGCQSGPCAACGEEQAQCFIFDFPMPIEESPYEPPPEECDEGQMIPCPVMSNQVIILRNVPGETADCEWVSWEDCDDGEEEQLFEYICDEGTMYLRWSLSFEGGAASLVLSTVGGDGCKSFNIVYSKAITEFSCTCKNVFFLNQEATFGIHSSCLPCAICIHAVCPIDCPSIRSVTSCPDYGGIKGRYSEQVVAAIRSLGDGDDSTGTPRQMGACCECGGCTTVTLSLLDKTEVHENDIWPVWEGEGEYCGLEFTMQFGCMLGNDSPGLRLIFHCLSGDYNGNYGNANFLNAVCCPFHIDTARGGLELPPQCVEESFCERDTAYDAVSRHFGYVRIANLWEGQSVIDPCEDFECTPGPLGVCCDGSEGPCISTCVLPSECPSETGWLLRGPSDTCDPPNFDCSDAPCPGDS